MRKDNSIFKTKFISEPGSYIRNADYFAFVELQDYACYCIADGIDDDKKRQSAELAVTAVINAFYAKAGTSKRCMKHYLKIAHKELLKETKDIRLEASILIVLTNYKKIRWGCAGNTRLFHLRNGRVLHKSSDQSLSQNLAEKGEIPLDRIEQHEERHNLYCYLGQPGRFLPYISPKYKLEDGDIITLCTRGIWENTGVAEILDAVEEASDPEDVCAGIEDVILSQQMKWISNYTIACTYINKVYQNPKKKKIMKRIAMICTPIIMILAIFCIVLTIRSVKKSNQLKMMWQQIGSGIEDIDKNGKIFEETNTFKQAAKGYENFVTAEGTGKKEIADAKGFIDTYNYIQTIEKMEAQSEVSYIELYKQYGLLLGLANGKEYIGLKRTEQEMMDQEFDLDISQTIDREYLSEDAKKSYESIIEKFESKFDMIMKNAKMEDLYNKTTSLYQDASNNTREYINAAKKKAVYDYDNKKQLKDNKLHLDNGIKADVGKEQINGSLKKNIKDLLNKLKQLNNEIVGEARKEQGNSAKEAGNYKEALDKLEEAKKAFEKAGNSDKADNCSNAIDNVKKEQSEKKTEKATSTADKLLKSAEQLYENGDYESAKVQLENAKQKYEKLGSDNKIADIKYKIENINKINQAKKYETEGQKSYKEKDFENAKKYYELAEGYYRDADLTEESILISNMLKNVEKKIEEKEKKEEEAKEKKKNTQ